MTKGADDGIPTRKRPKPGGPRPHRRGTSRGGSVRAANEGAVPRSGMRPDFLHIAARYRIAVMLGRYRYAPPRVVMKRGKPVITTFFAGLGWESVNELFEGSPLPSST